MSSDFFGCEVKRPASDSSDPIDIKEFLATVLIMKPKASPYPLIRVGGTGDGAYLIPDDLSGIKACFSPGVNNFKNFEDHLAEQYGIACHMCDMSSDVEKFRTPLRPGLQTFRKSWLDVVENDDCISLERWVGELAPDAEDLLLQIDIEGAEYRNLLQTSAATLARFRIIVCEFHDLSAVLKPNVFRSVFEPLFKKLDSMFVCVHAHPNNCCGDFKILHTELNMPHVHELTFLRRDRITAAAGRALFAPLLPHPLDIGRNVAHKAPLFLNPAWTDGCRAPESRAKMLEDELDYLRQLKQRDKVDAEVAGALLYRISQNIYLDLLSCKQHLRPIDLELTDVALGKRFVLSSAWANLARDGRVIQTEAFFFHTADRAGQSITVDLEDSYFVWAIRIVNRSDGFFERANHLFYSLHESADPMNSPPYPLNVDSEFLTGRSLHCDTTVPGSLGRYLTIFSTSITALHFSNLQVFARLP